ncbi:MAG: NAD(P)/FAD-dependent oxidoreductase [bacterium]|nr:NAD(P)/FAD-dependent oxidoreductase [bacterium]
MKVGIIGGGIAGLSVGYYLSMQRDIEVTIFEKKSILGGLASSFKIDGDNLIERYYHFICSPDNDYLNLIDALGLQNYLNWKKTKMGLFYNNKLYPFGTPIDLLKFSQFTFLDKIKFGLGVFKIKSKDKNAWKDFENTLACQWLPHQFGQKAYEIVHKPLLEEKFGSFSDSISAAWMWARIHRLGKSRTKILQLEKLGYLFGGTNTIIEKLAQNILQNGGKIIKDVECKKILLENNKVKEIICDGITYNYDIVISTIPSPLFLNLVNDYTHPYFDKLKKIDSIGVMCVCMRLVKSFSKNFWLNISDSKIPLAGIIEYTNLNPCPFLNGDTIVYIPQYLPANSEEYSLPDDKIIEEYIGYLKIINPEFNKNWIKSSYVFRDEYAQPICEVGFTQYIPEIKTPIEGLYLTDSYQLHPDDRAVSYSIGLGKQVTKLILAHQEHK